MTRRFVAVATAGIAFQAGSAAVDSATIMSALVFQLSGSSVLVGAVTAILRFGWLFPQLFVGFLAQRDGSSMRYYVIGAFGRASCLALLAVALYIGAEWPASRLIVIVLMLWTAYAFVSGIVAVPYNDIVAQSVPSKLRSRLLALRFFGGGVLALGVVALANWFIEDVVFPVSFAALIAVASGLMFLSSGVFTSMGQPSSSDIERDNPSNFRTYLNGGVSTFRSDHRFRRFVYAQWCGGAVLMAMPFYVVQADFAGLSLNNVALLLGVQTAGALASNVLWGWWGDVHGKISLLRTIAIGRILPPASILMLTAAGEGTPASALVAFVAIFFVLGALANGLTIAVIGYLMEISPDRSRSAYSGYFNAITAPAFFLPLIAGVIASISGLSTVFAISMLAAILQSLLLFRIDT